jgi:hypothetical protein
LKTIWLKEPWVPSVFSIPPKRAIDFQELPVLWLFFPW